MALDFSLAWHQRELQQTARAFLSRAADLAALHEAQDSVEGFSVQTHRELAELGWLEIGMDVGLEHAAGDAVDLVILYEELGRAALPGPHFVSHVAARLLRWLTPHDHDGLVSELMSGRRIATVALYEASGEMFPLSTRAADVNGAYQITGEKGFVPYAAASDVMLVLAGHASGSSALYLVDLRSPGLVLHEFRMMSGERQHRVEFHDVPVGTHERLGEPGIALKAFESMLPVLWLAQAAELVGLADAALQMAVKYAKERVAFGHAIGSYQAIQHKCAEMVADVDAARYLTYQAACLINMGLYGDMRVLMAKAFASGAARRVTKEAHQIFAAAGYVLTNRLNYYYRRAKGVEVTLGGTSQLLDKIAVELL